MSQNLEKFDHIVVLMMENRSFDHMLGYLTKEEGRTDIDGLTGDEINELAGNPYGPYHLDSTSFPEDPKHDHLDVMDQLSDNNGGFVRNFHQHFSDQDPGQVMGYYDKNDLPVYHFLVNHYLVCDRWFSSIPGATSPNRAYAVSGTTRGQVDNPGLPNLPPYYNFPTIFERLTAAGASWKIYDHDISWLRIYQQHITDLIHIKRIDRFLDDLRDRTLPDVSWIEPNYEAFGFPWTTNDDHPKGDVQRGQKLVMKVYKAIRRSSLWDRILFVITYDEHGGFYDHVQPPSAEDDWIRQHGVRVPAIVVSPFVPKGGVSHTVFDHTSIIKTILLKYCANSDGLIDHWMSKRVKHANHLGLLLTEPNPNPKPGEPPPFGVAELAPGTNFNEVSAEVANWDFDAVPPTADMQQTDLQEMMRLLAESAKQHGVPVEQL